MTGSQNSKLNMFQTTLDVCNLNREKYQEVPAFVEAVSELSTVISDIRQVEQSQSKTSVKSASLEKSGYEDKLVSLSLRLANAIYVYAFENKDQSLLTLTSINKSTFFNFEGNKKLCLAQNIYKAGVVIIDKLSYYGIKPEILDDLQKALSGYEETLVNPIKK